MSRNRAKAWIDAVASLRVEVSVGSDGNSTVRCTRSHQGLGLDDLLDLCRASPYQTIKAVMRAGRIVTVEQTIPHKLN